MRTQGSEYAKIGDEYVEWTLDEHGYWNLRFDIAPGTVMNNREVQRRDVHAYIGPRPEYCDRGHWQFNAEGPFGFDYADSFPRYYMDLRRAKDEAVAFLNWRIYRIR